MSNSSSGLHNYQVCQFSACKNDYIIASSCSSEGGFCSGDTLFKLFDQQDVLLDENDDSCGSCSKLQFEVTSVGCSKFYVHQGCFGTTACGGQVVITSQRPTGAPSGRPSGQPSSQPSKPTLAPTVAPSLRPTFVPSRAPTLSPSYQPTVKPTAIYCASPYQLFYFSNTSFGCFVLIKASAARSSAAVACNNMNSGWLATFDTLDELSIPGSLGVVSDTYFGLHKTSACTLSACNNKLAWESYGGIPASVSGYTLNMDSQQPKTSNNLYFSIKSSNTKWQDVSGLASLHYICESLVASYPTRSPTGQPTGEPSGQPSVAPSLMPSSSKPSGQPSSCPSSLPSAIPSLSPYSEPTGTPSGYK